MPTLSERSPDLLFFFAVAHLGPLACWLEDQPNADGVKGTNTDGVNGLDVDDELEALFKALCDCIANGNNCNLDLIPHPF